MTTTTTPTAADRAAGPARTTAKDRVLALGRAELTLLVRNKAALSYAVLLPGTLTLSMTTVTKDIDLEDAGLSLGMLVLPGSIGLALILAVYLNLVGVYVIRREELVLKRLRAGEPTDAEILAGSALPAVLMGLVQCVLLAVSVGLALDVPAPKAPYLAVAGVAIGLAQMVALAAATAAYTRTGESAQLTPMPLMLVSMMASGLFVPLEVMPDQVAAVCERLPLTPVVDLVRGGWSGGMSPLEVFGALVTALAWTVLAWWTVRRRFFWEPRR
ncbi:ABC transporter permease [Streptomyces hygroscopicus]|uniref:ABC transporter permease n=1 Tax=Streptomyces hygroscopicus TaxID=1912 RepID=UPI0007DB21D1|nr:ABC transporter permease [Streptomyces sp. NBRC 109436]